MECDGVNYFVILNYHLLVFYYIKLIFFFVCNQVMVKWDAMEGDCGWYRIGAYGCYYLKV